ncbi:spaetzle domain-containing protein [Phthorimaea operculella]|nr:spaetzle domain-containing protein [Phthorimaea operculella]
MAVLQIPKALLVLAVIVITRCEEDDLKDFEFSDPDEVMIAQESRQYQTIVKPPIRIIKPHGITNSHRPQYNLDSLEEDPEDVIAVTTRRTASYRTSQKLKAKESMIKDAVLRALERKDHVGKFAQILPIIRAMSGNQRVALASLVASQVSTPPGRTPLNLSQVRSMFGNNDNTTSDLMLPILLDMANLIRRAVRSGKEPREVRQPLVLPQPHPQLLRRSFTEDTYLDDEPFELGVISLDTTTTTTKAPQRNRRIPNRNLYTRTKQQEMKEESKGDNKTEPLPPLPIPTQNTDAINDTNNNTDDDDDKNGTRFSSSYSSSSTSTTEPMTTVKAKTSTPKPSDNSSQDLTADQTSTNQTLAQDLPVAEKLRAFNRFIDRKGNLIRRGNYPKPSQSHRRSTPEPTVSPIARRRPAPARKLPPSVVDQGKCELFTNTLCLHSEDYPTELIVQSIRRNKAAAGALLADFKDPGEGALDGVTADQEAKYTAEHYLQQSNRRGDTATRDFASAGEAGFMCPSTVKYARPQRARATSGQWKYIVNTGEHTQTLRLEKCLKPKESCTYLTDNFKSKCVQVYNYHRLLTWDQQNGLHMDIFKVPTCCSCHIEGYSVSFPPLGHRVHETSSEQFPGEDLSPEHGNQAFENVQQSVHRPTKSPSFSHKKPLDSFPQFTDGHNLLVGSPFVHKMTDNDDSNLQSTNPMDSYGNTYFPDSFNQASTNVRNVKRPLNRNPIADSSNNFDQVTLPSYLEPPTPSAPTFSFAKENNKFKQGNFKRGLRPRRRPIRKKIGGPDDLTSSGTSAIENLETMEDFNDDLEEAEVVTKNSKTNHGQRVTIAPKLSAVSTERPSSTLTPPEKKGFKQNVAIATNGKRVNYNYHPIIDFFEEESKEESSDSNASIDREDSVPQFIPSPETEWKPINHPPSRNIHTSNLVGRKKHK